MTGRRAFPGRAGLRRLRRARRHPRAGATPQARHARLILLAVAVGLVLLTIGARCLQLQVLRRPALLDLARSQQEKAITLDPHRGPLLDRNGKELALSLDVDSIFADPAEVGDPAVAAHRLAPILGIAPAEVRARLEGDRHFAWLKRKVAPDVRRQVEALGLRGIGFVRESRRYYPKRNLAAHVLGACGVDNQGLAGLEFAYDGAIQGTPGRILFQRDGRGGRVLDRARTEPKAGAGFVLTIDEVIQHIAERELDAAVAAFSPAGACVVILRPQTGEILALASRPTFDPNAFADAREEARRDRAVSDYYEPGSTFKVITASAALDAGRVRPDERIWCENGAYVVGRHRFREDHTPFGELTFTEVLAKSSNIGAIKVGARLQPQEFIDYIRGFGFGRKTGIELPGESPGMLRDLRDWSGLSQASIAMGQEIGVTPLQLAAAIGAVANDGIYARPHVLAATITPDGRRLPARGNGEARETRVISAAAAATLRTMLESVTIDGTGKAAAVPGYTVAGKTGTAQKVDATGHYSHNRYVAWFAGFVPAGRPSLVLVVMVDEPKGRFHGGEVAAPVFSRIALPVVQYLGIAPDREGPLVFDRPLRAALREGPAASRDSAPVFAAVRRGATRSGRDLPLLARGTGETSDDVLRASARSDDAVIDPDDDPRPDVSDAAVTMPDLTGMSLRQASEMLASLGITCRTMRSGSRVTGQEPNPGQIVRPGSLCAVAY